MLEYFVSSEDKSSINKIKYKQSLDAADSAKQFAAQPAGASAGDAVPEVPGLAAAEQDAGCGSSWTCISNSAVGAGEHLDVHLEREEDGTRMRHWEHAQVPPHPPVCRRRSEFGGVSQLSNFTYVSLYKSVY